MNLKLEGKYFVVFISITLITLLISIISIFPLYEYIETLKHQKQYKNTYYIIDGKKYIINGISAEGNIIMKRVFDEN